MGNNRCGSIVVIAIPMMMQLIAYLWDSFYGKNYVLLKMQTPFCAILRDWKLLAAFGGSYAPVIIDRQQIFFWAKARNIFLHFDECQ